MGSDMVTDKRLYDLCQTTCQPGIYAVQHNIYGLCRPASMRALLDAHMVEGRRYDVGGCLLNQSVIIHMHIKAFWAAESGPGAQGI